ncbi:hypothetical protein BS50DRAFT_295157 [Corynespora cassiicola Philippines]|uniref:Uncharacterized protein n=1 Tax=Corynespora cassiicola Philippines TaxID=1448308 RepID=A0A2T2NWE5_CORCC|nr:hypothetical protein BS50DRAFT_295157 [Corynespora cassiicola Philippines]
MNIRLLTSHFHPTAPVGLISFEDHAQCNKKHAFEEVSHYLHPFTLSVQATILKYVPCIQASCSTVKHMTRIAERLRRKRVEYSRKKKQVQSPQARQYMHGYNSFILANALPMP